MEGLLGENFGDSFRNQQQLKRGLDAAEVNQRAMAKVVQDLTAGVLRVSPCTEDDVFAVALLGNKIDWGKYYRAAEDDIEVERLELYKQRVANLGQQANSIEASLAEFESDLQKELGNGPADVRKQAVDRFLADLKHEIAKVRAAAKVIEENGLTKDKVEQFNDKLFKDTLFMISRNRAKKEAAEQKDSDKKVVVPSSEDDTATVTEFGG